MKRKIENDYILKKRNYDEMVYDGKNKKYKPNPKKQIKIKDK